MIHDAAVEFVQYMTSEAEAQRQLQSHRSMLGEDVLTAFSYLGYSPRRSIDFFVELVADYILIIHTCKLFNQSTKQVRSLEEKNERSSNELRLVPALQSKAQVVNRNKRPLHRLVHT